MGKLLSEINTFRKFTNQELLSEEEFSDKLFGNTGPNWDLGSPEGHRKRHPGGSWADNNAYDIRPQNDLKTADGTPVYSLTSGKVSSATNRKGFVQKIKNGGKYNLFGSNVTVSSSDGPDVFYTHLQDLQVTKGDEVKKGQLIGYVGDAEGRFSDHVHVAVSNGDVKDLVNSSTGEIKGSSGTITPTKGDFDFEKILDNIGLDVFTSDKTEDEIANKIKSNTDLVGKNKKGEWEVMGYELSDIIKTAKDLFSFESTVKKTNLVSEILTQKKKLIK
jgi:murein DD-endopeptidase MepM/ murein hydrolase activator NlpD